MSTYSLEHKLFLKKKKRNKWIVRVSQLSVIIIFLQLWEMGARLGYINTFLSSSPSKVFQTFISLLQDNNLWNHVWVTVYETLVSFTLASGIGFLIASILWWNKTIAMIVDPYLTVLNSLPKVALGPLIIIWVGANTNSIIFMALLISTFITIINIYQGFISTDHYFVTLMHTFNAKKYQIFGKLIVPSNKNNLINCLKVNISMSLIGVIMGELLVSKEGLGYLIMYGSQVFNINLVITSVVLLGIISYIMYEIIVLIEKKVLKH